MPECKKCEKSFACTYYSCDICVNCWDNMDAKEQNIKKKELNPDGDDFLGKEREFFKGLKQQRDWDFQERYPNALYIRIGITAALWLAGITIATLIFPFYNRDGDGFWNWSTNLSSIITFALLFLCGWLSTKIYNPKRK